MSCIRCIAVPQENFHMIDPDIPAAQESENTNFSFKTHVNQTITINNYGFSTKDIVNEVYHLLEPHVTAATLLIQWIFSDTFLIHTS